MRLLLLSFVLFGCSGLTAQQKEKLESDTYKACKVVVQVHELRIGEAGAAN